MTASLSRPSPHDRIHDLLAGSLLASPAVARILVTLALAELQMHCAAPTASHCRLWQIAHDVIRNCVADLDIAGDPRIVDWRWQADACRNVAAEMLRVLQSRRPGRGITHAEPMPRTWQPSGRVIDMATIVAEVAS